MLEINNLHASIAGKEILKGISLSVKPGEIHAIMGPNGSGKSTLSKIVAGHPDYQVTSGRMLYEVNFKERDLLAMEADERAREGIFLAFQYPIEVSGVKNIEFLRTAFNSITSHQGGEELDIVDFRELAESKAALLGINKAFLDRQVNVDFSGGEKKRNEILQMAILSPRLSFLDETDSGLDVDSLKEVAENVNKLRSDDSSFVLITHYQRILNYIVPDVVHILHKGRIIKTGDKLLAKEIEENGFESFIQNED